MEVVKDSNLNSTVESSEFTQYTFSQKVKVSHTIEVQRNFVKTISKKSLRNFIRFNWKMEV